MPIVSKADAIVTKTTHLAQFIKNEIEQNIHEKCIHQLRRLNDVLSKTTTVTKGIWAEQKSNIIPNTQGQTRVNNQEKDTQSVTKLPVTVDGNVNTMEHQKIVTSPPTTAFVVSPPPST